MNDDVTASLSEATEALASSLTEEQEAQLLSEVEEGRDHDVLDDNTWLRASPVNAARLHRSLRNARAGKSEVHDLSEFDDE